MAKSFILHLSTFRNESSMIENPTNQYTWAQVPIEVFNIWFAVYLYICLWLWLSANKFEHTDIREKNNFVRFLSLALSVCLLESSSPGIALHIVNDFIYSGYKVEFIWSDEIIQVHKTSTTNSIFFHPSYQAAMCMHQFDKCINGVGRAHE